MDTARNGAGILVEHANRHGCLLASWTAVARWTRSFMNSNSSLGGESCRSNIGSGAEVERFIRGTDSQRGSVGTVHCIDRYVNMCGDG